MQYSLTFYLLVSLVVAAPARVVNPNKGIYFDELLNDFSSEELLNDFFADYGFKRSANIFDNYTWQ